MRLLMMEGQKSTPKRRSFKLLTEVQKKYILNNYKTVSVLRMAQNRHLPVHRVRQFLDENKLEPFAPPPWNKREVMEDGYYFNVDAVRGEYTWLV